MTPWVRATLRDLGAERADLLVIGGGITGAGIARDAALRGLRVALVEARDFGSGTSSRSSRLIHGGLRYLEQGRLHLVMESLRERAILLELAPHLIRPLPFVLPFFRSDRVPGWKARLGLTLYDLLAGRGNVRRHQTLGKRALLEIEPLLRESGLTGGALYYDAQCDDARLTLAVIRAAARAGARVANYTQVAELLREGDSVTGARLRDEHTGAQGETRARIIINATGPWTDAVRQLEAPGAAPILRLTKGVHLIVPQARIGNQHAILFTSPLDGRVMFVLPWNEWTYVGTTDTDSTAVPDAVTADETDLVYLLRSANAMFPGAHLGPEDVVSSWAGLRPLLGADPGAPASLLSREHRILRGPLGMLTIAGGKLTTFRSMARDVVDRAMQELDVKSEESGQRSKTEPLPGGEAAVSVELRRAGRTLGLSSETVQYLVRQYGTEIVALYRLCRERPELRNPLHPEHAAIAAQVVFGIEQEFACTAADILERRTRLALETRDHGDAARPAVERLLLERRGGLS
ncbi:MAG TPA: glycerol-3-phosphate dehydrogenase [Gemmatimonadales bacterium]|jgi:glycerol-3-phosphate dehydrogenase|nr:glycerol-3-phosphate dehydrogenase [Gemmatimonadales bacterium]